MACCHHVVMATQVFQRKSFGTAAAKHFHKRDNLPVTQPAASKQRLAPINVLV